MGMTSSGSITWTAVVFELMDSESVCEAGIVGYFLAKPWWIVAGYLYRRDMQGVVLKDRKNKLLTDVEFVVIGLLRVIKSN